MFYKKISLYLLLLTYLSGNFNINRLGINFSLEVRYVFLFMTILAFLIGIVLDKRNILIKKEKSISLFIFVSFIYLFQLLISFFYTINQSASVGKVETSIFLIFLIIMTILIVNNMEIQEFFKVISTFFIVTGILYVIPVYFDVITGASRGDGNISGPNVTTRVIFFASCSSMYRFILDKKIKYFLLSTIFLFSIILVGSRGGFLGAVLSLLLIFFIGKLVDWKKRRGSAFNFSFKRISLIILGILILYLLFEPIKRVFMGRFVETTFQNGTVYSSGRDVIYSDALLMIKEKPIFGYGIDSFSIKTGHVYPHNLLLEMMIEFGLIGLIIFVIFFIYSILIIFSLRKSRYFIFSGIPFYMIMVQMFSGQFYDFRYYFLWLVPLFYCKLTIKRNDNPSLKNNQI